VSCQSDLENTKEGILPVCDKPYHKIKENMPLGEKLENLWNYPLLYGKIFTIIFWTVKIIRL